MGADKMGFNLEKGGGHRVDMGLDIEALAGEITFLKVAATDALTPFVTPLIKGATGVGLGIGMIGELGSRVLSTGRGRAVLALLTVEMAVQACMAPVDGSGKPTQFPEVVTNGTSTEQAGVVATATYAIQNGEALGLPTDIEGIANIDPYDAAHTERNANLVADFVKESVSEDIAKNMGFWEVYGANGIGGGMLAHFTSGGGEWVLASYGNDGLGYLGADTDPHVAMQMIRDSNGFVSLVTPNGLQQIFEINSAGEATAFLPFGESEWVRDIPSMKIGSAAVTQVPEGVVSLLSNGGHFDFEQGGYVNASGEVVYTVESSGEIVEAVVREFPQVFLDLKLSATELKNFEIQPDGSVMDDRDKLIVIDAEGNFVGSIRYGNWVLNKEGKLVPGEVSTDNLFCVKNNKPCVSDYMDKDIYKVDNYLVDGNSTAAFERISVKDPKTGEVVGVGDTLMVKTVGGEFPLIVQFAKTDSPTANDLALAGHLRLWTHLAITKEESRTMLSADRLGEFLPAGFEIELYFAKQYAPRMQEFVAGYNPGSAMMKLLYTDPGFVAEQNKILKSIQNGTFKDTDFPFLYNPLSGGGKFSSN